MSIFFRNQKNSVSQDVSNYDLEIWKPDKTVPYVIHIPGRERKGALPLVCIWPKVVRHINGKTACDYLHYYLNREHICSVQLLKRSELEIVFEEKDDHFGAIGYIGNDPIRLSIITDEEFETVRKYYEKQGWPKLNTKGDLVQNYIDCLN